MNPLIAFYTGSGTDAAGRTLDEVQRQNPAWLERTHDCIQWLFPLPEPSRFNPSAPALDPATIDLFRQDPAIQARLLRSFEVMLAFYGFEHDLSEPDVPDVWLADDFERRSRNWLTPNNHNYLRISRILRSLRLLGLEECSSAWFEALDHLYRTWALHIINSASHRHWRMAAGLDER